MSRLHPRCPTWPSPRPRRRGAWSRQRRVLRRRKENLVLPEPPVGADRVRPQGQGVRRLGDPAPAHARARLGGRAARRAGHRRAASSSTPPTSPATTRRGPRSTAPRSRATRSVDELPKADWQPLLPLSDLAGDTAQPLPGRLRPPGHPRAAEHPPRRRRRPAAGARHGAARPAAARRRPVRPGRAGERRPGDRRCSNEFYGRPAQLIAPGLARSMGEGWETARRRDAGNDWVEVRAGLRGRRHPGRAGHLLLPRQRPGHRRRSPASAPDGEVAAAAAHPAAARHPAPLRARRRPRRRPGAAGRLPGRRHGPAAAVGPAHRRRPGGARPALVRRAARRPGAGGARRGRGAAAGRRPARRRPAGGRRAAAGGRPAAGRAARLSSAPDPWAGAPAPLGSPPTTASRSCPCPAACACWPPTPLLLVGLAACGSSDADRRRGRHEGAEDALERRSAPARRSPARTTSRRGRCGDPLHAHRGRRPDGVRRDGHGDLGRRRRTPTSTSRWTSSRRAEGPTRPSIGCRQDAAGGDPRARRPADHRRRARRHRRRRPAGDRRRLGGGHRRRDQRRSAARATRGRTPSARSTPAAAW